MSREKGCCGWCVEGRNADCWRARWACRSILAETSTTFVKCPLIGEAITEWSLSGTNIRIQAEAYNSLVDDYYYVHEHKEVRLAISKMLTIRVRFCSCLMKFLSAGWDFDIRYRDFNVTMTSFPFTIDRKACRFDIVNGRSQSKHRPRGICYY